MSDVLDFAIVGGGASGIYTAWRLANAGPEDLAAIRERIGGAGPLKIAVHERSQRIGGRLLSASPALMPDEPMELGGMRYLDNQPLVKALVEEKLKVAHHPQEVDQPGNFAWLRRKLFREDDLCSPFADLPYGLTETEKAVITATGVTTPAQLIFWAVFQEFPEINGMPPEQLKLHLRTLKVDGKPLYQVGFWNLLSRHLSHEGRELAITAIGYDVLGANANSVDIIAENFDFTSDSKYYLFDDGFEAVLWRLADEFAAAGDIRMGMSLESFDDVALPDGDAGVALTFDCGAQVDARAIVLAMPQAAIKALRRKGPLLDPSRAPDVPVMLNAVEGIPLYKLFLIYETPWWQEKWGLSAGRSLTDIPLRQCYYWSTNTGAPSAIMAYNDQASTSFWGGYQTGPLGPRDAAQLNVGPMLFDGAADGPAPADDVAKRRRANWDAHKAPHEMVVEMHRQLMEMHGVADAPAPVDAAFMDWMNAPYGGAVHFWNPGYKSWEMLDAITQPVAGLNAFIVGEAYSTVQTWVEGAFQTSEIALQKRLGMAAPAWVPDGGGKAE